MRNKLWTRDYSIITVGSIISMLGNAVSNFALGLLVFDNTGSTFLYALFFVATYLPQLAAPLFAGPFLDRFSRRKAIYGLDFFASAIFLAAAAMVWLDFFNYWVYLFFAFVFGATNSVYTVAFDSFYPDLISEGNFSRAYSINSLIYPLANTIMVPVAGVAYETVGLAPLLLFNAATFFVTAMVETRVSPAAEKPRNLRVDHYSSTQFRRDFAEGLRYLKGERGLLTITSYFIITMFAGASVNALMLPWFQSTPGLTVTQYTLVMSASTMGRLLGGFIHYKYRYPKNSKFAIAIFVYVTISFLEGAMLFLPVLLTGILLFITGCLAVTSYNIRISGTQSYVPNEKRGRFNGLFLMLTTGGQLLGQLIAGMLGEIVPAPWVIAAFMVINAVTALAIMLPNKKYVKVIYNQDI